MKPFAAYGKKPRGSKTSKREVIEGLPVFLHYGTATGHSIIAYHDSKPYPRIAVFAGSSYWNCKDKLDAFFSERILDIRQELDTLNVHFGIPKDILDKAIHNRNRYEIYNKHPNKDGFRLVFKEHEGEYIYLFANPSSAPTKNIKGKKVLDGDKIYGEYISRLSDTIKGNI